MATFEKIAKRLLTKEPFYGLLLLTLNKRETNEIPTMGVCLQGINHMLLINPEFWNKLTDDEQFACLKHELMHICFKHTTRLYDDLAEKELANYAMDCEINQYIKNLPDGCVDYNKIAPMIPGLEPMAGSRYYYREFRKLQSDSGSNGAQSGMPSSRLNGGDDNDNSNNNDNGNSNCFGNPNKQGSHEKWKDFDNLSEAEKELVEQQVDYIAKNVAEQVIKSRGTIPGEIKEYIDSLFIQKPPVFNWKAYFRRLLGCAMETFVKTSRKKPSKRFEGAPGLKHKHKHNILVGIDTSGSVSEKELLDFFSEINYIYKAGAHIDIVECDAQIGRVYPYKGHFDGSITGRGGTDFKPVIDYYNERKNFYSTLVFFTDGYAPIDFKPMKHMLWVITSNGCKQDYPGKAIYIPAENE